MADVRRANCQLCGYFCGVKVTTDGAGRITAVRPDPERYPYDPAVMAGCRRFAANLEILNHPARINHPLKRSGKRGSGKWERVTWEQALAEITGRLQELKGAYGAETLATCISAPHTVYWPMHRFLNLWGSPNNIGMGIVCWNPRIWVNTLTCGWPVDDELQPGLTRCAIIWGVNPAQSDRSVFWKNLHAFAKGGGKLVVVDPRRTETARLTDDWVSVRPGTDGALALAMLHVILAEGLEDRDFVRDWCSGFDALAQRVRQYPPEWAASICGVPAAEIRRIARLYAGSKPASIYTGLGIDQSGLNCTQTLRTIAILRAVTGNIDLPGASLMNDGSDFVSEVELELNHLMPEEQKRKKLGAGLFPLQRHEGYRKMLESTMRHGKQLPARYMTSAHPGLAWQAMISGDPYPIRALICMASNPMLCQADTRKVHRALSGLDLLVTLEKFLTPTAMLADYVLPVTGGFEQPVVQMNGGVANILYGGEAAIRPLYERRTDFEFWMELGKRLGQQRYWPWETLSHAMDDILSPTGLTWGEFCETGLYAPEPAYLKYLESGFATPSGKVELYSSLLAEAGHDPLPSFRITPDPGDAGELQLITGVRRQPYYSSEFRQVESLRRRRPEPLAEMAAETAASLELNDGDLVWIQTAKGRIRHRLRIKEMYPGTVSVELGWWFPERAAAEPELGGVWEANANVLTSADVDHCDPILGQWSFRGIPCRVYRALDLERTEVRQAGAQDWAGVMELLAASDMDCSAVPVEEFFVLVQGLEILAAVRLEEGSDSVMIRPIVVADGYRGQGGGRHLLERVLPRHTATLLVARGGAVDFYTRLGFTRTSWNGIPSHQVEECKVCPDRQACSPLPLVRYPVAAPSEGQSPAPYRTGRDPGASSEEPGAARGGACG
ncbi:GNAT family N-acetyltransferase [Geomonas azotofigens]|uniref:GNAT family N-acetyltransferase n=1 Tax=Geomonas azotofigens TaxID=2843196 RepID=UPI001C0F723A|nr:GNAT family N-acetyltransferase [Geomonas azotofigens]MBU5613855.1 GNAT family N-acetyltransferase [Geomonas azotofigens]